MIEYNMSSLGNWLDLSGTSNRYIQTYVRGFMDISGGNLIMRNNGIYVEEGDSSFNGNLSVMKRLAVGKAPDPNNNFALEVSGAMFFGGGDASFNGNTTINNNIAMGGLIQQSITPISSVVPQVIYAVPSALFGTGIVYLGSKNVFYNTNTFTDVNIQNDLTISGNLYVQTNHAVTLDNYTISNDMSLNGRLYVNNDASLGAHLYVASDISGSGRLFISSDASLGGRLFIQGDVSTNGYIYAKYPTASIPATAVYNSNLFTNDISLNGRLYVSKDASMNGRLFIGNDASLGGRLFVQSDITTKGRLFTTNDASLGGRLFVQSDVTLGRLFTTNDVSLGGGLFVAADTSLNGQLFVGNNASLGGGLFVAADTSLNGQLFVGNNASLGGVLFVKGNTSTNGQLTVASDISANGRLFIAGDTSLNGNLFLHGNLIVQNSTTTNIINTITTNVFSISEDISLNGRIRGSGDASFGGNLYVSGNLVLPSIGTHTISGNVTVTGNSTCGNSTVTANETVSGTETITGLLTANGGLTVASGQTLTVSGVTITGLTTASVGGISAYLTASTLASSLAPYAPLAGCNFTGSVGIGQASPSYPLHIGTTATNTLSGYYLSSTSSAIGQLASSSKTISIYTSGVIYSGTYLVASDERVKTNIQSVSDNDALHILLALQPKTFTYIDTIQNGIGIDYGFIAQDLLPVFDKAVTTVTDTIPNIYDVATVTNNTRLTLQTKTTDLFTRDSSGNYYPLRVYDSANIEFNVTIVSVLDTNTFEIDIPTNETQLFVYGQTIPDFHSIRWNDITTVNTASIQALYTTIQSQNEEIVELKKRMETYDNALVDLQQQIQTLLAK